MMGGTIVLNRVAAFDCFLGEQIIKLFDVEGSLVGGGLELGALTWVLEDFWILGLGLVRVLGWGLSSIIFKFEFEIKRSYILT